MKKTIYIFLAITLLVACYRLYVTPKIVGLHHTSRHIIVMVVKDFPWTAKGKIKWWKKSREDIFNQLRFNEGIYSIYIYESNYKKDSGTDQDSDLRCFKEMNIEENCISKDVRPMIVRHYPDGRTEYITENIFQRFLRHL